MFKDGHFPSAPFLQGYGPYYRSLSQRVQCLLRKALEYVFKDIQGKSQLFPGNRKGRIEIEHISQRPQQKPLGKRFLIKFIAHAAGRIIRRLLLFIRHQFQGMDQSDMPDFPTWGCSPTRWVSCSVSQGARVWAFLRTPWSISSSKTP